MRTADGPLISLQRSSGRVTGYTEVDEGHSNFRLADHPGAIVGVVSCEKMTQSYCGIGQVGCPARRLARGLQC